MPGERLVLDPRTESAANAPIELVEIDAADVRGVTLLEHDYPAPEPSSLTASSADTEGDPLIQNRYGNRQIPVRLRVVEPADAAATNLVADPSFETASGLWAGVGGGLLARSSAAAREGDTGALITVPASAGTGIASPAGAAAWPCSASTTYTAAAYVRAAAASDVGKTVQLLVEEITNAGATVGGTNATVVLTAQWQRLSVSRAFGATGVRFRLWLANTTATAFNFHADQVQMIAEASASNYFDGDTPGCAWTGTQGASTSTRPATGGPRFYAILADLEKKLDRINREGGTLKRVVPDGAPIIFDVVRATFRAGMDRRVIFAKRSEVEITLTAKPFGRGATEVIGPDNDEATLPALTFTTANVQGDVPALGRLIVTERQGVDQARVIWGLRSRYYDAAATAGLFFEAEGRTLATGAATAADATASGGSLVRLSSPVVPGYRAVLTTQATGGGAHLTHTGTYRVLARVRANTEFADVTFDYAEGDLTRRSSTQKVYRTKAAATWELADLGVVRLSRGRWEGRILVRSPIIASTSFDVDYLMLVPVAEAAGEAAAATAQRTPTSYAALAGFGEASAGLSGSAADLGGNWTGGGDTDDFTVTNGVAQRAVVSDTGTTVLSQIGRMNWINGLSLGGTVVSVDFLSSIATAGNTQGVVARVGSTSVGVRLTYTWPTSSTGNGSFALYLSTFGGSAVGGQVPALLAGTWYTITLYVDLGGRIYGWLNTQGAPLGDPIVSRYDSAVATGGSLAAGAPGIIDTNSVATAVTRQFDNFQVWVPPADAAVYANRQLEVRSTSVRRQDSGGTVWGPVGYTGDYLLVPASGPEGRTSQVIVKGSRGLTMDPAIDDIRGALAYTPRYLVVPG